MVWLWVTPGLFHLVFKTKRINRGPLGVVRCREWVSESTPNLKSMSIYLSLNMRCQSMINTDQSNTV